MKRPGCLHFNFPAILICLLMCQALQAQVTPSGNGYLFRVKFVKGQLHKYSLKGSISTGQRVENMAGSIVLRVDSVSGNKAIVHQRVTDTLVTSAPIGNSDVTIDDRWRLQSGKLEFREYVVQFPARPIRVGESYTYSTIIRETKATVTVTFKRLQVVARTQVAILVAKITGTGPIGAKYTAADKVALHQVNVLLIRTSDGTIDALKGDQVFTGHMAGQDVNMRVITNCLRQ